MDRQARGSDGRPSADAPNAVGRRYRSLVASLGDGLFQLDEDDHFVDVDDGFADLMGRRREDLLETDVSDVLADGETARLQAAIDAAGEGADAETVSLTMRQSDGTQQSVDVTIDVVDGESPGVVGTVERVETARTSATDGHPDWQVSTLVENVPGMVYRCRNERGWPMEFVSDAFAEMTGYDREELLGRDAELVSTVGGHERGMELRRQLREGEIDVAILEEKIKPFDGEPSLFELERDGHFFQFQILPIRDDDGEVFAALGMSQDITERRLHERKIEESERRYRALAEHFPNGGVGVFDENLRYTLVTGTMWDDIPPDAEDLEGESIREALPPETAAEVEPIFRSALEGETNSVVSQLGGRTYRVWAMPLRDADGEITAGQSFAVDITDQLQREAELEASNERLEQFAYAASHDLQEPLRMVSSYLSLIERRYGEDLPEDAIEFLEYAVDGAERMREMIDALLEYSRVETQGRPFETVDLEAVLEDVLRDLRMRIEETGAEITVGSLPETGGDEDQLRQVFQNLLDNAIEYSGDGRPRIDIDAERNTAEQGSASPASPEATQDDDEWVVSVQDEGIGIDAEHTDSVFEVFQRLHTQDEHSGTGIGLALCRRIIERHDGEIWAESDGEDGTTFYFTLPVSGGEQ